LSLIRSPFAPAGPFSDGADMGSNINAMLVSFAYQLGHFSTRVNKWPFPGKPARPNLKGGGRPKPNGNFAKSGIF
ncbi:MAG: hypothetical protein MI741_03945, partial [Rhodospirillales bacterium]|nr:hypothetical protein [Rhodospirillales bacterium]